MAVKLAILQKGRLVCSNDITILSFTEIQMSAANTNKALYHNFDVLNSKMLITKLDSRY